MTDKKKETLGQELEEVDKNKKAGSEAKPEKGNPKREKFRELYGDTSNTTGTKKPARR